MKTTFPADTTVICDTHRAMDLIPAFLAVLPENGNTAALRAEWNTFTIEDFYNGVADDFLNDPLWDAMQAAAPDGTYFGASEGNGSDFAFWTVEEEIEPVLHTFVSAAPVDCTGCGGGITDGFVDQDANHYCLACTAE